MNNTSPSQTPSQSASANTEGAHPPSHQVLVNHEEQYCLWPAEKTVPNGWRAIFSGSHQACLDHVEAVWTDMRPLSVREG
ncbi:MAG: MbtH family NRPS accessory protein [Gammaproteobacteria bacterium]|nr:MbtH family NRPS accessory protein [Gammaproteobacteria bacterium]